MSSFFQEEDPKKGFTFCPQEKNCFKLRRDREKRVFVVLQQTSGPKPLIVKKFVFLTFQERALTNYFILFTFTFYIVIMT